MPDIFHDFIIRVSPERVFGGISTPEGLDEWWTKASTGRAREGEECELNFGPKHIWRGRVTKCVAPTEFELQILTSDPDWNETRVGFRLRGEKTTNVSFHHTGWPAANDHWRFSSFCWAMYLRILRRHLEHGETVPFERRLDV
jgi:uncharacterized protein YndB with AHSA1/START domain